MKGPPVLRLACASVLGTAAVLLGLSTVSDGVAIQTLIADHAVKVLGMYALILGGCALVADTATVRLEEAIRRITRRQERARHFK